MKAYTYDFFVIGAGSGGVRAARVAAEQGARVGIAEAYRYGGACVIRGCIPKKLLVYAAQYREEFEDAVGFGWQPSEGRFDWVQLIANKNREIDRLEALYQERLLNAGVTLHHCRAVLEGPHTIFLEKEQRRVTAHSILIATGGTPNTDTSLPGHGYCITSDDVFDLPIFPKRIVIVGGGYIAVEFACIFNGLGAQTTLLYRGNEILRGFDQDMRTALHQAMELRGIRMRGGDRLTKIEKRPCGTRVVHSAAGCAFEADQVLMAVGRSPKTEGLGLEKLGITLDRRGAIQVDSEYRTKINSIYAVGDVTNRMNLTPVAIREGQAVAQALFGKKPKGVSYAHIPTAVFSHPEVGMVGMTEEEAVEKFPDLDIYLHSFRPMKHGLSGRNERAVFKMLVDTLTDRVVGVHVFAEGAAEMTQLLAIPLRIGATKEDFDNTMALHPSAAEEWVTLSQPVRRLRGGKIVEG